MTTTRTSHLLDKLRSKKPIKILFVCLGNICRSPAAHGVFQQTVDEHGDSDRFVIDSCGTQSYHAGDLPDSRMRMHARRRGFDLTHISRKLRPDDFTDFDLIIGMDQSNIDNLRREAPTVEAQDKIVGMAEFLTDIYARWDCVPDPYYEGAEGFELVLDLLQNGCANLYAALSPDTSGRD